MSETQRSAPGRLLVGLLVATLALIGCAIGASASNAATADQGGGLKVFVCKYVGKPGVDERLQTGNNPIDVSVNSIKDYAGVGSSFSDAQGRSYVLAEDNGQTTPDVSQCAAVPNSGTPSASSSSVPSSSSSSVPSSSSSSQRAVLVLELSAVLVLELSAVLVLEPRPVELD